MNSIKIKNKNTKNNNFEANLINNRPKVMFNGNHCLDGVQVFDIIVWFQNTFRHDTAFEFFLPETEF